MFGKKKDKLFRNMPGTLYSPVRGRAVALESVNDEVFAGKVLGDGVAFYSDDGVLYAPCRADITMVADTGHALGFRTSDGVEVMLHIGIDTVSEKGAGFTPYVKKGTGVEPGQRLISFDRGMLEKKGYDLVIPMVISDSDKLKKLETCGQGPVEPGEPTIHYEL